MKLKFVLLISSAIGCIFIPSCAKKDEVKIAVNLPKGFSALVRRTIERETSLIALGIRTSKGRTMTNEYLVECLDVDDDGVMRVKQTYKSCKVSGYRAGSHGERGDYYEYDMSRPSDDVPYTLRFHAARLGESLIIYVSPEGETIDVDGAEALADKLMGEMGGLEEAQREPTRERLIESLEFSRVVCLLKEYPRKPKSVGRSWKRTRDMSRPLTLGERVGKRSSKFKLVNVTDGVANLKKKSTFEKKITEDHSGLLTKGTKLKLTLKENGTSSSEIKVALATGVVLSSRTVEQSQLEKFGPMTPRQRRAKSEIKYKTVRTVETIIH
ncbi:MAG: DUF6263 family protein [Planctomycetota bacterium]|jgi:hypothetical protein